MFKKLICVFLLSVSLTSVTACSGNEGTKKEETPTETVKEETTDEETVDEADDEFTDDEAFDTDEGTTSAGNAQIDDMIGKTFSEALAEGYEYQGYSGFNGSYTFQLKSVLADDATMEKVQQLEGLTVKELIDKDLSIGYAGFNEEYELMTDIGSVNVSFEVDGAADIIKQYKEEDSFADIADMEELYDKPISNVSFNYIQYNVTFDETFDAIASEEDFELDSPETQLSDCVIKTFSYEPIPEDFLN